MCNGEVEAQWVTGKWRGVGETLEPLGIEQEAYGSKAVYTEGRLHLDAQLANALLRFAYYEVYSGVHTLPVVVVLTYTSLGNSYSHLTCHCFKMVLNPNQYTRL